jgi:hypothetical protein
MRRLRVIQASNGFLDLVAGKAEEMAAIVQELMDDTAMNESGGTLFGSDEVDREQEEKASEGGPWHDL